jgi:ActR/RegA family two-component response regulator
MSVKILFIDDDENILASFKRSLRMDYLIETASSPEEGLRILKASANDPFAVVVSDLKMPKISGIDVLRTAKKLSPHTVRIMLTGYADIDTAINAVNEGNIFRFLTKPCSAEQMKLSLKACVDQHKLIMAEKELLRDTLQGSVKMLVNVLSMHSPEVFGRSEGVKKLVNGILSEVSVEQQWQLEVASMLVYLGYIALPSSIMNKVINNKELTPSELSVYNTYPENGAKLVANIPRLNGVSEIIAKQRIMSQSSDKQPVQVRIINLVLEYLELEKSDGAHAALTAIKNKANVYGIDLVNVLQKLAGTKSGHSLRSLNISDLREQMILDEDVLTVDNLLLCKKGQELNDVIIMRLLNYGRSCGVREPIKVLV